MFGNDASFPDFDLGDAAQTDQRRFTPEPEVLATPPRLRRGVEKERKLSLCNCSSE
jgi:hypothetical protein